jgi:hypothetical protein
MIIFLTGFVLLLLAWTVTEMIRYSMYAIQLVTTPPYLLTWLRYFFNALVGAVNHKGFCFDCGGVNSIVADPNSDPDPPDLHVLDPPGSGSGSISQRYGSGSFYHQAN